MKPLHRTLCSFLLGSVLVLFEKAPLLAASAETESFSLLPPAAQQAFDKGLLAMKTPDYLLAAQYFQEARQIAPAAPEVFLNFGLAESKIPSRELRALAWFGAYLAASPNGSNAPTARAEIAALELKNKANLSGYLTRL